MKTVSPGMTWSSISLWSTATPSRAWQPSSEPWTLWASSLETRIEKSVSHFLNVWDFIDPCLKMLVLKCQCLWTDSRYLCWLRHHPVPTWTFFFIGNMWLYNWLMGVYFLNSWLMLSPWACEMYSPRRMPSWCAMSSVVWRTQSRTLQSFLLQWSVYGPMLGLRSASAVPGNTNSTTLLNSEWSKKD